MHLETHVLTSEELQSFIDVQFATIIATARAEVEGTTRSITDVFALCFPINSMQSIRLWTRLNNGSIEAVPMTPYTVEVAPKEHAESLLGEFPGAFRKLRHVPSGPYLHALFMLSDGTMHVKSFDC